LSFEIVVGRHLVYGSYVPTVDPSLIADQRNFRAKYLQNCDENWTKKYMYLILALSISRYI